MCVRLISDIKILFCLNIFTQKNTHTHTPKTKMITCDWPLMII